MAGKLRALLTAPWGTCAVVAMAPGFVIAFLGVVLGPLSSVQEKLHNVTVSKDVYYILYPTLKK